MSTPSRATLTPERILDSAPEGIVGLDRQGRVTYANRAAAQVLGYAEPNELVGQLMWSHMQFLDLKRASGTDVCWRADGTKIPVDYSIASIDDDGDELGTVLTFRDVSERAAAERAREELISVVSHELRTPLTAIRSGLGLLGATALGPLPAPAERLIQIAVNNADRLIRLLNDMLDLERVRSGQSALNVQDCDVHELMRQAADGIEAVAAEAGVSVRLCATSARLEADPYRLLQVLTNLLANAIKFSPAGGRIWLDAEEHPHELVLRVRDEGRGIPASQLERIFNRFAQVEASDAREKGGTGLGLAISRAIVEQHGGQIWAESTLGLGTTVCVAFPTHELGSVRVMNAAA